MTVYEQLMSQALQVNPESRTVNTGTTTATATDLAKIREEHAEAAAEKQRQAIHEYADAGRGRTSGARLSYVDKRIASGKIPNHTTASQLHYNNAMNADFEKVQAKMEEYSNLMKAVDYANAIVKEASNGQYQNVKGTIAKATVDARTAEQEAARVSEWLDRNYGIKTNGTRIDASGFYGTFFGNQMGAAKKAASEAPIDTIAMLTGQDVNYLDASTTDLFKSASEDDLQLYKYLLEQDKANGTNRAETFKTFLQDNLAQKRGAVIAQNAEERDKGLARSLMYGSQALAGGASAALNDLRDTITGEQGARSASEYSSDILRQGLAEEGRNTAAFFFDAAQSVGAMAPGLVAGTINPAFGAVIFGTTAGSSGYQDKLDEGWSQSDAAAYGVLSGISESALQYALGGIGLVGGLPQIISKAVGKIPIPVLRAFTGTVVRGGAEFLEEFLQTYIEPAIVSAVQDSGYETPELKDALRNGFLGAVASFGLGGGAFVHDLRQANAKKTSPQTEQANLSANNAPETANNETTLPETQEAKQAPSERFNQQDSNAPSISQSSETAAVLEILARGRVNNEDVARILGSPEGLAVLRNLGTEITDDMTTKQKRDAVNAAARQYSYAQKSSQNAVEASFDPLAMLGLDEIVASEQSAKVSPEQEAQRAVDESVSALQEYSDTEVDKENAAWAHDGGLETYMLVRDIVSRGASYSEANKILSNPEMKSAFEDMFGKLPENRGEAKQAIVDARIKPKAVGDDAFDASAMLYPELAADMSAEVEANKNARVPAGNLVITDPSNMVSPEARERGISVTPDEAEVKAGVADITYTDKNKPKPVLRSLDELEEVATVTAEDFDEEAWEAGEAAKKARAEEERIAAGMTSYIRGLMMHGATAKQAKDIVGDPKLREIWEKHANKTLPSDEKEAINLIRKTKIEPGPVERVMEMMDDGITFTDAHKILSSPDFRAAWEYLNDETLPNSEYMAMRMLTGAGISAKAEQTTEVDTPTKAEPKTTPYAEIKSEVKPEIKPEIKPEVKVEAPTNRANAKADTSTPKGKVDWSVMDEMSAAKKEDSKNAVPSNTQTDKTSESKVYDANLSAEENEAVNANMASDVGKGASDFAAELREGREDVTRRNTFGSHAETASKATKSIADRIKSHLGENKNATKEQKADGFAVPDGDREALTFISQNAESLANGQQTISQFVGRYKTLGNKNNHEGKRFYFPEVQEKLESAEAYLLRESPDVERGTRAAAEAMQLLDKRISDRLDADESIRKEVRDMPRFVEKIKSSALYNTLLKTGDGNTGRQTRLTLDLLSPNNFLKMFDGFNAEGEGVCYALSEEERACNIKNKSLFAKANSFFNKLLADKNAEALLTGKVGSGVYFNGVEQLSATELLHLVRALDSIKATRGEDGLNTVKGIGISRNGKTEVLRFDYNGNKTPVSEQLEQFRSELDILLADNSTAKAYDDALTEMLAYMHPELNSAHVAANGYDMGYVGEGKYFPVRYTSANSTKSKSDVDNFFDGLGVTKERVKEEGGIIKIDAGMEGINQYMQSATQYAAWASYSGKVQMLMQPDANGMTLADVVSQNLGVGASGLLENYANDLKFSSNNKAPTAAETALGILRKNLGQAAIRLKITTPVKQAAGTLAAAGDIKMQYLLAAQFGAGKQFTGEDNLLLQHRRLGGIDPTLGNINNISDTWWERAISKVKIGDAKLGEWALTAVSRADSKAILNIYKAAALQVSAENGGADITKSPELQKKVDELFANALLGTQSDMTSIANSEMFRSDSELKKNITLFKAQQNAQLNATISALLEAHAAKGTKNADAAAKKAGRVVAGQIASSFEFALLGTIVKAALHKFKGFTDEEDELSVVNIAKSLGDDFIETLSGVYLFGDTLYGTIKTGINVFSKERTSTLYDPSIGGLNTVLDIVNKLNNLDKNPSAKTVKDLALSVSTLFGVPLPGVYDVFNAGALWVRDASRAISGKKNDTLEYSDILDVAKDAIEWSKATDEQRRLWDALGIKNIYAGRNFKNAPAEIEYDDSEFKLTKQERKAYQGAALEASQAVIDELVNSALYKNATDEQKAGMMKSAVSYGKDVAKKSFVESKGLEYESDWDDERVLEDLPGYLAFKAMTKEAYGDKDETPDYDAIDALLGKHYGELSEEAQELIAESYSKIDDLYEAKKLGIDSETWYGYKAEYDKLKARVEASVERTKAIEAATGVDTKVPYNWDDAAKDFAVYIEKHAKSPKQAALVRDQLTYWQQIPGNTETYDKLRELGLSPDSASHTVDLLGSLKPQDGNKTVVQRQKHEAIAFDETLTDSEKFAAMIKVTNANSPKRIANIEYCRDNGISPEDCYWKYLAN